MPCSTGKRFILTAMIDGQEVVRRAVYANSAEEVGKVDALSDAEMERLERAVKERQTVSFKIFLSNTGELT